MLLVTNIMSAYYIMFHLQCFNFFLLQINYLHFSITLIPDRDRDDPAEEGMAQFWNVM